MKVATVLSALSAEQWVLWVFAFAVLIVLVVMQWNNKLPTTQSVSELASAINSRGGNIMVLAAFSVLFFISALRFTYWVISRASSDGTVTVENSVAMAAFTWMTGSAFGGAFTSMVKAMTGENTKARATDTNGTVPSLLVTPGTPSITPLPSAEHVDMTAARAEHATQPTPQPTVPPKKNVFP